MADAVVARAYTSPTLVLLAMDWPGGRERSDFLGFAIRRAPGYAKGEKDGYLTNKIGFSAPGKDAQPLPSNLAPIQKFMWWDGGINDADRGKTFEYTIIPVCGTGPSDLALQHDVETMIEVELPLFERDGIWTCFNRAVVSSQAFQREFPDPEAEIDRCMAWLANGLQDAFPLILKRADAITGAIYHLTDDEWVVPALKAFKGKLEIVYNDQAKKDTTDRAAIGRLESDLFKGFPRSKTHIMHDKFLVDRTGRRVLAGSANFTPEGLTSQANLLHVFDSPDLADLFIERATLMQDDPSIAESASDAGWSDAIPLGKARIRVFFSPEPTNHRVSIDTVIDAVEAARSSVVFCMFDPTDPKLIEALLATGDHGKLLYGLLNSISDPDGKQKDTAPDEPPAKPSASTEIRIELFNRSQHDRKAIAYNYFRPGKTPAGFLPELSTVDFSSRSTLGDARGGPGGGKGKRPPPAVHIHHKFIIIDAETDAPTIFTGSANLSRNSTNFNDENLLEITGSPELAQTYLAEFMRLYEHYRARAIWNMPKATDGGPGKARQHRETAFTLKTSRDAWVKGAYKDGTPEAIARVALARARRT